MEFFMPLLEFFSEIVIFLLLVGIGLIIFKLKPKFNSAFFNPIEYLPEDEIHTLKQVSYLILMALCFINVMYSLIFITYDVMYLVALDVCLSLYIALTIDKSTWKGKLMVLLLVPYGALTFLMYRYSLIGLFDLIHVPVFIYYIRYYYNKFQDYTQSHGLGITIILLFSIIFVSFIITNFVENNNPLNAIVMVSNAFTSNGYAVLGDSVPGKLNSIVLVWSGFIISGVGTATLTAAILTRTYHNKFEEYDDKLEELNGKLDKFEELNGKLDKFDEKFENLENLIKKNND